MGFSSNCWPDRDYNQIRNSMNNLCWPAPKKRISVQAFKVPPKNKRIFDQVSESSDYQNDHGGHRLLGEQASVINIAYAVPPSRISSQPTASNLKPLSVVIAQINPERNQRIYWLVNAIEVMKEKVGNALTLRKTLLSSEKEADQRDVAIRLVCKSQYETLIQIYKAKKQKWIDTSFPIPKTQTVRGQTYKLAETTLTELAKTRKAPLVFIDSNSQAQDISQGTVGSCYFLSAVAALTRQADRILRLFPLDLAVNPSGIYMARLMLKGILQEVVVDDRFPVLAGGSELFGCKPNATSNEIYVMVLEKCWAKLWKSYEAIDGGFPHQALHALTGALTRNYYVYEETTPDKRDAFWKKIYDYYDVGYVMCTGTHSQEFRHVAVEHSKEGKVELVIAPDHIYCVEQIYLDQKNLPMVRLYNPWGENNKVNGGKLPGEFAISWEEYYKNFHYLTVCKIHDQANYVYEELEHCRKDQFTFIELQVGKPREAILKGSKSEGSYFAITISETDQKEKTDSYLRVTYIVLKYVDDPTSKNQKYEFKTIRTEYEYADHYLELHNMTEGRYLICIYFSEIDVKEDLTFGVYSEADFTFEEKSELADEQCVIESALMLYANQISQEKRIYPVKDKDIWFSFNIMVNRSMLGYLVLHVGPNEQPFQLDFGRSNLAMYKLSAWKPYDNEKIKTIHLEAKPGSQTIAIIKSTCKDISSNYGKKDQIITKITSLIKASYR